MKSLAIVVVAAAGLTGCGSGTPFATYCNEFQTETCNKVFQCADPASPPDPTVWGSSPTDCAAMLKAANCAGVSNATACPVRETYHPDKADACVADLKAADCPTYNAGFTSANCVSVCS